MRAVSDVESSRARLIEALLQVPGLVDRAIVDARVAELRRSLDDDVDLARSGDPAEDLAALVTGVGRTELRVFAEIIARHHRGPEAARFAELAGVARRGFPRNEDRILGDIPIRNRNFTGRSELLDRLGAALSSGTTTSVLPPALKGLGGVGKTQLVTEYVHRHIDSYDLIWWIPAEQTATVLASLTQLAERLGLPVADDQQETARTVLNRLATGDRDWLLVYDNADHPSTLRNLLPSTGGHVIVTTRVEEWSQRGVAIEVDVFFRRESIELLTKRTSDPGGSPIAVDEADELADKLGDLPLALEQAAAWYLSTAMPIREYIDLLDKRVKELLDEGQPADYPLTVAAFVRVAVDELRTINEATAQMFSLFAFLGGEGVRQSLLNRGTNADIRQPLRQALGDSILTSKIIRDLRRYGLAKTIQRPIPGASGDRTPIVQVHRLVQRVLRDTLPAAERDQAQQDVQNLLGVAKPGDPDEVGEFERQREMGPHLEPAGMIHSSTPQGRQTVLDHARYLYLVGDYENSRALADDAATAWARDESSELLGPNGQSTLLARAQVANALRALGDSERAATILRDAYDRFEANPLLGPSHPYTLITGNQLGHDLRIRGSYQEALEFDTRSLELHRSVFGEEDNYTLRVKGNVAVDYRLMGQFARALDLDDQIVGQLQHVEYDVSMYRAQLNVVRNYYGLGAYKEAQTLLDVWMPRQERALGVEHGLVLMSERTRAITLRKLGLLDEAIRQMRANYDRTRRRFRGNPSHELSMAAGMSLANALRQDGRPELLAEALELFQASLDRYRHDFGTDHPLTLAAEVNEAIALRAAGKHPQALANDRHAFTQLRERLGVIHPYTLCAGTSLATDYAVAGDHRAALEHSEELHHLIETAAADDEVGVNDRAAARLRDPHPYALARDINTSHDMRAVGREDEGAALFERALAELRGVLGAEHPEVTAAVTGERLESDIEPPPT
jgi:tetratricopeptide (TPR) repeat protein